MSVLRWVSALPQVMASQLGSTDKTVHALLELLAERPVAAESPAAERRT